LVSRWSWRQTRTSARSSRQAKALAEAQIKELKNKVDEFLAMKSALEHLPAVTGTTGRTAPSSMTLD
jgi:hypothetical protein